MDSRDKTNAIIRSVGAAIVFGIGYLIVSDIIKKIQAYENSKK